MVIRSIRAASRPSLGTHNTGPVRQYQCAITPCSRSPILRLALWAPVGRAGVRTLQDAADHRVAAGARPAGPVVGPERLALTAGGRATLGCPDVASELLTGRLDQPLERL